MQHLPVLLCTKTGWHMFSITAIKQILLCSVQEEITKFGQTKRLISNPANPAFHAVTVLQRRLNEFDSTVNVLKSMLPWRLRQDYSARVCFSYLVSGRVLLSQHPNSSNNSASSV